MNFIKTILIIICLTTINDIAFSNISYVNTGIQIEVDESLAKHEVVLYSSNEFRGSSAKVKLGFATSEQLKKFKVYVIRSMKIGPQTKLHVHYLDRENETFYRSKEKTKIEKFTRIQVAEYGDFDKPVEDALSDPDGKIKGILYNSLKSKNVAVTAGRIDAHQLKSEGITFFKSYELAPGYEMTAFAFSGFKGDSQVVQGKGTLDRLCKSLVLKKIDGTDPIKVISPESTSAYATIRYNITKKQAKIKPGNYDHDQLMTEGIRFVQYVDLPAGYELWGYPYKGFKGDPIVITSSGKITKLVMSVKLKKSR